MTFIHGYLLGGLLLAGVPVLIHLVMRQKPKPLRFPAFRFLKQRHRTSTRKLRLQHLLLLLLRMAVIAAICLALARPRVQSGGLPLGGDRAVTAALVFDTSPSMDYVAGGKSRLDEARGRARELLDEMADGSRVALLETGDDPAAGPADPFAANLGVVRTQLDGLRTRPANGPLNRPLERALRLLAEQPGGEDAPPRILYVFSDRTRASWDPGSAQRLQVPDGLTVVFADVGVNEPVDLAIDGVTVDPPAAAPGDRVEIRVSFRATGADRGPDYETRVGCAIDGSEEPETTKAVRVGKNLPQPPPAVFVRKAPAAPPGGEGPCQVTVKLASNDLLPYDNVRHATFLVREPRRVLTIVDDPAEAERWDRALRVTRSFQPEVARPADAAARDALKGYKVAVLFQVDDPPAALLENLKAFVKDGGGLVVVPGELRGPKREAFNVALRNQGLLPAELTGLATVPNPVKDRGWTWSRPFDPRHALTAYFARAVETETPDFGTDALWPFVKRYWQVEPPPKESRVLATYDLGGKGTAPALVERTLGRGTVVEFTTALGNRMEAARNVPWHNYWTDSSFGLVLANELCRYLAGDSAPPELNFLCGQPPVVPLAANTAPGPLKLEGPDTAASESSLEAKDGRVSVPQATTPGNYLVRDTRGNAVAGFSLAVPAAEAVLERVPAADLEAVLGPGTVVEVGRTGSLRDALTGRWSAPVELLPWLMMLLLVVLAAEGLFANKFYRRTDPAGAAELARAAP